MKQISIQVVRAQLFQLAFQETVKIISLFYQEHW